MKLHNLYKKEGKMHKYICPLCRERSLTITDNHKWGFCHSCSCKALPISFEVKKQEMYIDLFIRLQKYFSENQIFTIVYNTLGYLPYKLKQLNAVEVEKIVSSLGLKPVYTEAPKQTINLIGDSLDVLVDDTPEPKKTLLEIMEPGVKSNDPCKNRAEYLKLKDENYKRKVENIDLKARILELEDELQTLKKSLRK